MRVRLRESLTQRPVHWTSRSASITFNQYGRDFPTAGMNDAGLVVALMDLNSTQYPAVDMNGPYTGELDSYFTDYTTGANIALVNQAYDSSPSFPNVSQNTRMLYAMHPEKDTCIVPKRIRSVRH